MTDKKKESAWKFTGRPHFTIWGYIEMPAGENKPITAEFETLEECHGYLVTKRIELPGILHAAIVSIPTGFSANPADCICVEKFGKGRPWWEGDFTT